MGVLSAISHWLGERQHELTEAIRQVLLWSIGMGLITHDFAGRPWDDTKTVLSLSAASGMLAVWAAKTTVAARKVTERVKEAHERGYESGIRATSSGTGTGNGH